MKFQVGERYIVGQSMRYEGGHTIVSAQSVGQRTTAKFIEYKGEQPAEA